MRLVATCVRVLLLVMPIVLTGCGTFGETRSEPVKITAHADSNSKRPIALGRLQHEKDAARLLSVGVFAWGKFDDQDEINLRNSMQGTLREAFSGIAFSTDDRIDLYIWLRKYLVAASNNEVAVFVGVDWCAADKNRQVHFQDTFYAAKTCRFPMICTLGSVKNSVHDAIVERIVTSALALSTDTKPSSTDGKYTFARFEDAAAKMPEILRSTGGLFFAGRIPVFLPDSSPQTLDLGWAAMREPINWMERLK
jgi:hypothetical protein